MSERIRFMSEGSGGQGPEISPQSKSLAKNIETNLPAPETPKISRSKSPMQVQEGYDPNKNSEYSIKQEGLFNIIVDPKTNKEVARFLNVAGGNGEDSPSQNEPPKDQDNPKEPEGVTRLPPGVKLEDYIKQQVQEGVENRTREIEKNILNSRTLERARIEAMSKNRESLGNYFQFDFETDDKGNIIEETENVYIDLSTGQVSVLVPKDPHRKWEYINRALTLLEQNAKTEGGGPGIEQQISKASTLIAALENPQYIREHANEADPQVDPKSNLEVGQRLYKEFIARLELHKLALGYETADGMERVASVVGSMKAGTLNTLLHNSPGFHTNSEVAKAMNYYEEHMESYLTLREPQRAEFREDVKKFLAAESGLKPEDVAWAQMTAEKLLTIWGRFAGQDKMHDADMNSGNYFVRRLLNFKTWVKKNEDSQKLQKDILYPDDPKREVSLNQNDFLLGSQGFLGKLNDYYKGIYIKKINDEEKQKDKTRELTDKERKELEKRAEPLALERVQEVTGEQLAIKDGKLELAWTDPDNINFSAIKFNDIDFSSFALSPLLDWSIYNLASPDKLRDKLVGKTAGLLRTPTMEALFELKDDLFYMSGKQWEARKKLLVNTLYFLMTKNKKVFNRVNLNFLGANTAVDNAVANGFIKKEQQKEVKSAVLGPKLLRYPLLSWMYLNWGKAGTDSTLEFFKQIFRLK